MTNQIGISEDHCQNLSNTIVVHEPLLIHLGEGPEPRDPRNPRAMEDDLGKVQRQGAYSTESARLAAGSPGRKT